MATVTHYIYSHNDGENNQATPEHLHEDSDEIDQLWEKERMDTARRARAPPRFVPSSAPTLLTSDKVVSETETKNDISSWYRSLNRQTAQDPPPSDAFTSTSLAIKPDPALPSSSSTTRFRNSNDWFISRIISSELPVSASKPADSLAQMLERAPPSQTLEGRFKPPVLLALGPENVGYGMLQAKGWIEGEVLGSSRRPRAPRAGLGSSRQSESIYEEEVELDDEITELRRSEVLDLTMSSDDDSNEEDEELAIEENSFTNHDATDSTRVALVTPLATVLKADRLGIGLKAKTEGPYRASKKRITHGQAAIAAHIRVSNAVKRQKATFGRGRNGLARQNKRQQVERQDLIQYLNS